MIRVLGLDLSLTATGVAGVGWATTLRYPTRKAHDNRVDYCHRRRAWYRDTLADAYLQDVQLAVLEGLGLAYHQEGTAELAGQNYQIRDLLWQRRIPYAVVAPSALKRYATGVGNASKAEVSASVRHWWPQFDGDDNAADAAVLAAMGAHRLGQPVFTASSAQTLVANAVTWPEVDFAAAGGGSPW